MIPGTFYAWDRLPVLFQFVRESLVDGWQPFELVAPGSQKLQDSDDAALAECNLVSRLFPDKVENMIPLTRVCVCP